MAKNIKDIRELIKAKIAGLEVEGAPAFAQVTGYAEGNFSGYPAAAIFPIGGRGIVIDTHRTERTFEFDVCLYQEQSEEGRDKLDADAALVSTLDAVIEAFDQDRDLGGEVEVIRVTSFQADFKTASGPFNYATVKVEAVVILPNFAS